MARVSFRVRVRAYPEPWPLTSTLAPHPNPNPLPYAGELWSSRWAAADSAVELDVDSDDDTHAAGGQLTPLN